MDERNKREDVSIFKGRDLREKPGSEVSAFSFSRIVIINTTIKYSTIRKFQIVQIHVIIVQWITLTKNSKQLLVLQRKRG